MHNYGQWDSRSIFFSFLFWKNVIWKISSCVFLGRTPSLTTWHVWTQSTLKVTGTYPSAMRGTSLRSQPGPPRDRTWVTDGLLEPLGKLWTQTDGSGKQELNLWCSGLVSEGCIQVSMYSGINAIAFPSSEILVTRKMNYFIRSESLEGKFSCWRKISWNGRY